MGVFKKYKIVRGRVYGEEYLVLHDLYNFNQFYYFGEGVQRPVQRDGSGWGRRGGKIYQKG